MTKQKYLRMKKQKKLKNQLQKLIAQLNQLLRRKLQQAVEIGVGKLKLLLFLRKHLQLLKKLLQSLAIVNSLLNHKNKLKSKMKKKMNLLKSLKNKNKQIIKEENSNTNNNNNIIKQKELLPIIIRISLPNKNRNKLILFSKHQRKNQLERIKILLLRIKRLIHQLDGVMKAQIQLIWHLLQHQLLRIKHNKLHR